MSGERSKLDAALAAWPAAERTPEEWEASAERIEARLRADARTKSAISDDDLFAAPLPSRGSEGKLPTARDRAKDRAALKDLVKLAEQLTPRPEPVQIAPLEEELAVPPPPVAVIAPVPPPPPSSARVIAQAPRVLAPAPEPEAKIVVIAGPPRRSRNVIPWSIAGICAIAAGIALFVRASDRPAVQAVSAPSAPVATTVAATDTTKQTAPATATGPAEDRVVDPSALPVATSPSAMAHASAAKPALPPATSALAANDEPPPPAATATAPSSPDSLDEALRQAAGVTPSSASAGSPATVGAGGGVNDLPLRPATGAVQAAIMQVQPAARACLAPDDGETTATIVFGSSGAVQRVIVSGGAAGKPAESCIRAQLTRAHIDPFAEATFSWSVLLRGS